MRLLHRINGRVALVAHVCGYMGYSIQAFHDWKLYATVSLTGACSEEGFGCNREGRRRGWVSVEALSIGQVRHIQTTVGQLITYPHSIYTCAPEYRVKVTSVVHGITRASWRDLEDGDG
jgi:hypothetical protein